MIKIKGTITSLVTPFKKNKKIDYFSLEKIINFQINSGIKNILFFGSTGEFSTLKQKEKIKILKFSKKIIKNKVNIIVGSCYNSTNKSINFNKKIEDIGINAIMQCVPSYIKPNQLGIYKHFKSISKKTYLPIILYDIQKRTGSFVTKKTLRMLLSIKNVIGIKKSTDKISEYISFCKITNNKKKSFYCGDDIMLVFSYLIGANGCISVISNFIPKYFIYLYEFKNSYNENHIKLFKYILNISNICNIEPNPVIIKYLLYKKGLIKYYLREPLYTMKKKNIKKLENFYNELQVSKNIF
ncbi:4-hydroxy-tetrahydrodipicolinate synthase [Candidatus Vidania fulgoroideorum]